MNKTNFQSYIESVPIDELEEITEDCRDYLKEPHDGAEDVARLKKLCIMEIARRIESVID